MGGSRKYDSCTKHQRDSRSKWNSHTGLKFKSKMSWLFLHWLVVKIVEKCSYKSFDLSEFSARCVECVHTREITYIVMFMLGVSSLYLSIISVEYLSFCSFNEK